MKHGMAGEAKRTARPERAGLYIRPATRDRLNVYKAARSLETGAYYSHSDAIDELLALAYEQASERPRSSEGD